MSAKAKQRFEVGDVVQRMDAGTSGMPKNSIWEVIETEIDENGDQWLRFKDDPDTQGTAPGWSAGCFEKVTIKDGCKERLAEQIKTIGASIAAWTDKKKNCYVTDAGHIATRPGYAFDHDNCPCCKKYYNRVKGTCSGACPVQMMQGCTCMSRNSEFRTVMAAMESGHTKTFMAEVERFINNMSAQKAKLQERYNEASYPRVGEFYIHENGTGAVYVRLPDEMGSKALGRKTPSKDYIYCLQVAGNSVGTVYNTPKHSGCIIKLGMMQMNTGALIK